MKKIVRTANAFVTYRARYPTTCIICCPIDIPFLLLTNVRFSLANEIKKVYFSETGNAVVSKILIRHVFRHGVMTAFHTSYQRKSDRRIRVG